MENFLKSLPDDFHLYEFKLEKVLGQGGFGITYLALDTNLMQHVAIKEYYPREFANRDSTYTIHAVGNTEDKDTFAWGLKRFLEEARVLAQLNHPNIISIKRFFEAHGTAYLVMEYCDGKPLDEIIRDHGPLDESELNGILLPLLDGLEHVHDKAFLHRDIKPANIFIRRNGSPVLLDFGAAKHEMTTHSKSVTSLATAGYAPFEQYSTRGKQGAWSDIYGLAATIYRAISGIKPQDAPDRMLEDTLEPASELLKGKFSASFLIALDKALAIRPESRPQSVAEFRELIKNTSTREKRDSLSSLSIENIPETIKSEPILGDRVNPVELKNLADVECENSERILEKNAKSNAVIFGKILFGLALTSITVWFVVPYLYKKSETIETQVAVVSASETAVQPSQIPVDSSEDLKEAAMPKPVFFGEIDRAIDGGQLAKAKTLLKEVMKDNPDSAAAYFRLGKILAKEDRYSEARDKLNKAKKIDPSLRFSSPGKFQELYNEILAMEKMSKLPGRD